MMPVEASPSRKKRKFLSFGRKKNKAPQNPNPPVAASKPRAVAPPPAVVRLASKKGNGEVVKPKKKKKRVTRQSTWLTRTSYFRRMSAWAFEVVDADGSGSVDEKELYSGLLLIHLKLGCYAGPAACRPVDRKRVHDIFEKMDVDDSGSLDREEFEEVMQVLCSNVLTRVIVQWSLTLIIVPLVAQYILEGIYLTVESFWKVVTNLDEYSPTMDKVELFIEGVRDRTLDMTPGVILRSASIVGGLLAKVPESVWNTIPLTVISCILGILAVPYALYKIDEYFQALAETKKKNLKVEEEDVDE